jgi:hypothetical protein
MKKAICALVYIPAWAGRYLENEYFKETGVGYLKFENVKNGN